MLLSSVKKKKKGGGGRNSRLVTKALSRIFSPFCGNGVEIESHDCLIRTTFAMFPFAVSYDLVAKSNPMEFEWKYSYFWAGTLRTVNMLLCVLFSPSHEVVSHSYSVLICCRATR